MQLTEQQVALIQAVGKANPRSVVVLNNGSAIDMRAWLGDVGAVLEAWLPGQAGAGAIIDILYGDVNPSGKLGETFPLSLSDTPAYLNFPGEGDEVRYGEGIFVGYRAYEALARPVLFPFGFGLSYTQFQYSNLQVSSAQFALDETLQVSLDVTNTGSVAGKEIVQLYVHDVRARLPRPHKELKAFAKVALQAGESRRVTLQLDPRAFAYYDPRYQQWVADAGDFDLLVGSSSADIRLTARVNLTQSTPLPCVLHINSPLIDWMEDPRGASFVEAFVAGLTASSDGSALGVDMLNFFKDLPLTVLLGFQGQSGGPSPQDIVAGWLQQIRVQ
jgi:beta-glucosidase